MRMFLFLIALLVAPCAMADTLASNVTKAFVGPTLTNLKDGSHMLTCVNPTDIKATVYVEGAKTSGQWLGKDGALVSLQITGDGPTGNTFILRETMPFYRIVISDVSGSKPSINCELN